jgi:hypothetical protein
VPARDSTARSTIATLSVPIVAVGALAVLDWLVIDGLSFAEAELDALSNLQEKQIELFIEQSNLLTTLTGGLFAALGALALSDKHPALHAGDLAVLMLAGTFAGFALYFGYLSYQEVIWMLGQNFFNLDTAHVAWPRRMQFFMFLGGVWCGLYFALRRVSSSTSPGPS